jgi:seryl-tRNA synthetase
MTDVVAAERASAFEAFGLIATGAPGVHGTSALIERVVEGLTVLITRHRAPGTEVVRFPPVMSRGVVEKSGYLHSFPHLLGCVSCLKGDEAAIRRAVEKTDAGDWAAGLAATDLVLTPAACYPVYPLAAGRGRMQAQGLLFDVGSYCFRHEATHELGRFQAFRMREYVCLGAPDRTVEFRARWMTRAEAMAEELALPYAIAPASDPFFGRVGKLMAASQVEQSLKYELLVPLPSLPRPLACMSFNCHRDHFGAAWSLRLEDDAPAHSACVAFGLERLALALIATHGVDFGSWPFRVRAALSP